MVFTTRPDRVKRSTSRRAQPVFSSQRPHCLRQRVGDLLHPRMQELGDLHNLAVGGLDLRAHALEPARPDLQFGDPHGVLVGHAERKLACGFREQAPRAIAVAAVGLGDRRKMRQIVARVVDVLVVGKPLDAGADEGARRLRMCVGLGQQSGVKRAGAAGCRDAARGNWPARPRLRPRQSPRRTPRCFP